MFRAPHDKPASAEVFDARAMKKAPLGASILELS